MSKNKDVSLDAWILNTLSTSHPLLNNLPPCPFAKEALLKNQLEVQVCTPQDLFEKTTAALATFHTQPLPLRVLVCKEWSPLSPAITEEFVFSAREKFYQNDLWLLYDHPLIQESFSDITFNHGTYLILFIQKLSELCKAADKLKALGYYDHWPSDYYEAVVGNREKYYQLYLESLKPQEATHQ